MDITKADVAKFRKLYLKCFGDKLSYEEVRIRLHSLVRFMDMAGQASNGEQFIDILNREILMTLQIWQEIRGGNNDIN